MFLLFPFRKLVWNRKWVVLWSRFRSFEKIHSHDTVVREIALNLNKSIPGKRGPGESATSWVWKVCDDFFDIFCIHFHFTHTVSYNISSSDCKSMQQQMPYFNAVANTSIHCLSTSSTSCTIEFRTPLFHCNA